MKDARSLHSLMSATGIQHLVVLCRRLAGAKRVTIINYHPIHTQLTAFAIGLESIYFTKTTSKKSLQDY